MKRIFVTLAALFVSGVIIFAQTSGVLKITFNTSSTGMAGRNYAPSHCLAVWIEDQSGKFVKTLLVNAQQHRTDLNHWEAATSAAGSKFNAADAVSGATNTIHHTRTCCWDGRDHNGELLPDGSYKILMELTDINGTGNCCAFVFAKGKKKINRSLPDKPSFSSVKLVWEPVGNAISSK